MTRFHGSTLPPLAERLWFVAERGTAGWVHKETQRLWVQSFQPDVWILQDWRELPGSAWVLPFLQFPPRVFRWSEDDWQRLTPYVECAARFPDTPPRPVPPVWLCRPPVAPDASEGEVPF